MDQAAIGLEAVRRNGLHGGALCRRRRRPGAVRGRQCHGGKGALERAHGYGPQSVALVDDLSLFGEPEHAANRTGRRGLDQVFSASTAARGRAAAPVE